MDSVKIGSFLRELRKEKIMTQEALAEVFSVSNRTISRWETGSNLPDISLLVEIADFYELDIREILNGERDPAVSAGEQDAKPEDTDAPAKTGLQEIAAYEDENKEKMANRTRIYAMAGLAAMIIYVTITSFAPAAGRRNGIRRSVRKHTVHYRTAADTAPQMQGELFLKDASCITDRLRCDCIYPGCFTSVYDRSRLIPGGFK